jgi:hypothetical protein
MIPLITVTSSSVSYRLAVAGDKFAPGFITQGQMFKIGSQGRDVLADDDTLPSTNEDR